MRYYTIFLGNKLWTDVIDDMNTTKKWAVGGMLWTNKDTAILCLKNLQGYDVETEDKKFRVVEVKLC